MRIAFIGDLPKTDSPTGPERFASELFEEMKKHHEVWFYQYVCSDRPCTWSEKFFGALEVNSNRQMIKGGLFPILYHFLKNQWDILHVVTYLRSSVAFLLISKVKRVKSVYTVHGVIAYENQLKPFLSKDFVLKNLISEKLITTLSAKIVTVSSLVRNKLVEFYSVKKTEIAIIPNGIKFIPIKSYPKDNESKILRIIIYAGMQTRVDLLNQLINFISLNRNIFSLVIVGDKDGIKSGSENVQIKRKLIHQEWLNELSWGDICINISLFESFSLSSLEALQAGLCLFLNDYIGISEFLQEGIEFIRYNPEEPDSMENQLIEVYQDRTRMAQISANGRTSSYGFSVEEECRNYGKLYNLLNSNG